MHGRAASYELICDFAIPESVAQSQKWVLTAMRRYGQELVTMLWRILGNEQDVCDAYQDTFLQLSYHEGQRKPEHVKAYVFRTASNIAISMLRRKGVERRISREIAKDSAAGQGSAGSAGGELHVRRLEESLRYHIARLPDHLRSVLVLRDLGELSYAGVGRMLGISAGTARVYRCKAVQLLAVWMNAEKE